MGGWPARETPRPILPGRTSEAPPARYVELHCHSAFSLHEGTSRPEELVATASRPGYRALALTDHDSLAGAMQFAQAGKGIRAAGDHRRRDHAEGRVAPHAALRDAARLRQPLPPAQPRQPRLAPWRAARRLRMAGGTRRRPDRALRLSQGRGRCPRRTQPGQGRARGRSPLPRRLRRHELLHRAAGQPGLRRPGAQRRPRRRRAQSWLGIVATNNVHYGVQEQHRLHDVLIAVQHHTNLEEARPASARQLRVLPQASG